MSLSSYCRNCGKPNGTPEEMGANHCNECETARNEAMQGAAAKANEAKQPMSQTDLLYVGRQALMQRQHSAHQGFISPRDFTRATPGNTGSTKGR